MTAGTHDLVLEQGATFRRLLTVRSNGSPVNLTGYIARMMIRLKITDELPVWELTTEDGGITITPLTGEIELYISDENTATFTWKRAVYDLELESSTGDVLRLLQGAVTNSHEVTRD